MTIAIAWTRHVRGTQELIVASDSRLTSTGHVDICQKIFPLARGDAFLAFCGDTFLAFPLMFQVHSAIANFTKAADRSEDVEDLAVRVINLLNSYTKSWIDADPDEVRSTNDRTRFLFGGWSWRRSKFLVYPIQFSRRKNDFRTFKHSKILRRQNLARGEFCYSIGDHTAEFRSRLTDRIRKSNLSFLSYEPLDILGEMLSDERFTNRRGDATFLNERDTPGSIGGAPQAIKIYRHSNIRPIAVRWPRGRPSKVVLLGRPLFEWENTLNPIYDFERKDFHYPLRSVTN